MQTLRIETCETHWARLFHSGPIDVARQVIRGECLSEGLCVTIEPTLFIYAGGEETGFVVGLNNYPRFPWSREKLEARAERLCRLLLTATCRHSAMVQFPERTVWFSLKPEGA